MNTTLSSSQEAAKAQYEAFAIEQIAPIAKALDERKVNLSDFWHRVGQASLLGLAVPKEYGGQSLPFINVVLLSEAFAEYEPGLCLSLASHIALSELLAKFGTSLQKSRYLPLLARGESLGTLAIAEEQAGSDFKAVSSKVISEGDKLFLTGKKLWVVNGDLSPLCVVLARNEAEQLGLYLIDLAPAETLEVSGDTPKLGLRSASTNNVQFKRHPVHAEALLGGSEGGEADKQMQYALDVAKTLIAAGAVGLSGSALKLATDHARKREQFGAPIAQLQAIQWKLADICCETNAARLLTYRAAWSKDESAEHFRRDAAMCKSIATKVARVQSAEALQVLGAIGLTHDHPLERFYRDAKVMEIAEETSELQKQLIANELGVSSPL
jgi:alkylation response protein AidB-like acyl-CoA dehydrogenase